MNRLFFRWAFGMGFCIALIADASCTCGVRQQPRMPLYHQVDRYCADQEECQVRLADATPFKWDRVAFIRGGVSDATVQLALGFPGIRSPEFGDNIFFIRGQKVVNEQRVVTNPDEFNDFIFVAYDTLTDGWAVFDPNDGVFDVKRRDFGGFKAIYLTPLPAGSASGVSPSKGE